MATRVARVPPSGRRAAPARPQPNRVPARWREPAPPGAGTGTLPRPGAIPLPWPLPLARPRAAAARAYREGGARRLLNIAVAAAGLVLTFPLLLVIAALVKLTSRGPVLFTQTRVGIDRRAPGRASGNTRRHFDHGGRPFTMYKFRTMSAPADSHGNGHQVWALPHDPRVTPVGRVLRRFRLDELPQLWNVLRGDMNVVGPRPEQPGIFVYLREQIRDYQRRQGVRPGITGWAQINLSYDRTVDDVRTKLAYDLEYVRNQSAIEDLKIMLRTLPVMVGRRGAW